MVSVDEYLRIRLTHRAGMGINKLAQIFHHSKRNIRQVLAQEQPRSYPKRLPAPSDLDPFKLLIDALLTADEEASRTQR